MRIAIIALSGIIVIVALGVLGAVGLAPSSSSDNTAIDSAAPPIAEDACLTAYLSAFSSASAALARADADVARSLDGLLTANDDGNARPAIATATAARITYDDATAALADANVAFMKCAAK